MDKVTTVHLTADDTLALLRIAEGERFRGGAANGALWGRIHVALCIAEWKSANV